MPLERSKIVKALEKAVGKKKVETEYMPQHDMDLICGDCNFYLSGLTDEELAKAKEVVEKWKPKGMEIWDEEKEDEGWYLSLNFQEPDPDDADEEDEEAA